MAEYIEREALLDRLNKKKPETGKMRYIEGFNDAVLRFRSMVHSATAADVVEVRHGQWIRYELDEVYGSSDSNVWYKCSECQKGAHGWVDGDTWYSVPILSNYCPNCGVRMGKGGLNNADSSES